MKPSSEKLADYRNLRDELYVLTSRNYDILGYKNEFLQDPTLKNIISRRKMEKISTLSQLISVFDNQMLIFPDKRGISHFLKIVKHIQGNSDKIPEEYMTRVKTLTKELQPEDSINFVKPIPLPTAADVVLMPRTLKDYLVSRITDAECGQDGQHLILALGKYYWDTEDHRHKVGVKQGDFDRIERDQDGDYQKTVMTCLYRFEKNCQINAVSIDVTQHVIDLLKNEQVFSPPYKKIAKELKKMRNESSI